MSLPGLVRLWYAGVPGPREMLRWPPSPLVTHNIMSIPPTVVLVLEESDAVRSKLREHLDGPYRVLEAAHLGDVQDAEPEPRPDLVISDARAAGDRGLALYRKLQADPHLEAVPILLLVPPSEAGDAAEDPSSEAERLLPETVGPKALRRLVGHHLAPEAPVSGLPPLPKRSLEEAVETVIERRLGDPAFTAGQLAEAVQLSRRHLTRRMKETMGTTPAAFIRKRRLERAEVLLSTGSQTIAQVARAVGFASPSAFSTAFREYAGLTPSAYIEKNAG